MTSPRPSLLLFLYLLLFPTLVSARPPHPHDPPPSASQNCVPLGRWLQPANKQTLSNDQLLQRLRKRRVILLGEDHDNPQHHRWQLIVAAQFHALTESLHLGFESFPRNVQDVLDRWVAGELSEAEFLRESRWNEVWRYDAKLYLPLFRFARLYHIPMVALNVDRALVSRVGSEGWANIPPTEREGISDPAPPDPAYLELLARIYGRHASPHGEEESESDQADNDIREEPRFQRFVQGQLLWDRAMAEAIARTLRDGAPQVVAIAGAGHLMGGYGIPHQLADLGIRDSAVLLPWDGALPCEALDTPHFADAVFGMPLAERPSPPPPRLGIYLAQDAQGVRITQVHKGSIAESIDLRPGDLIVEMAGRPVKRVRDVVNRVQATQPGTWLPLVIQREGRRLERIAKFPPKDTQPS